MRAWACGERTMAAWCTLGHGERSSMKFPRPLSSRASSTRFTGCPIQLRVAYGCAPGGWSLTPMGRSSPRVLGRALFEKRRDALRVVMGRAQPRIGLALELEGRLQGRLRPAID